MAEVEELRAFGALEARAPRYTSYPPATRFDTSVGPDRVAGWLEGVPAGSRVSLYVHVPFCRRLCGFCACRTQGTASDRPLGPYVARLKRELALVGRHLPADVTVGAIHLGGGTPTILPAPLLTELMEALRAFRPLASQAEISAEIDPVEIDRARVEALRGAGLTRAVIGVQDFDAAVQGAIGRAQSFEATRDAVALARGTGARSLELGLLFGLPHQTRGRLAETVTRALGLGPDRVTLHGYAHVPWIARRQALIDEAALPGAEARHGLAEAARRLLLWGGFEAVGIDHFARPTDTLARAAREGRLRRGFGGYEEDRGGVLIGIGASALSRLPAGFAQNASGSSAWGAAVDAGILPVSRGHALTAEDRVRGDMIERLLCRLELDLGEVAEAHGLAFPEVLALTASLRHRFGAWIEVEGRALRLSRAGPVIARLAARELDAYADPDAMHSRAL